MTTRTVTKEYIISYTDDKCNGNCEALSSVYCGGVLEESAYFCVLYDMGLIKKDNIIRCKECKCSNGVIDDN